MFVVVVFFGGVGLFVDQDVGVFYLLQLFLYCVQFGVVVEFYVFGEQFVFVLFVDFVVDQYDCLYVFGLYLMGDLWYVQGVVYWLVVGYCYCIVVEDFVGDVDVGGDGLVDCQ